MREIRECLYRLQSSVEPTPPQTIQEIMRDIERSANPVGSGERWVIDLPPTPREYRQGISEPMTIMATRESMPGFGIGDRMAFDIDYGSRSEHVWMEVVEMTDERLKFQPVQPNSRS